MEERYGYCKCGCGELAQKATHTYSKRGYKKGDYCRFAKNHNGNNISEIFDKRFWSKVDIKSQEECWLWKGTKDNKGYGMIIKKGKTERTHRVSFLLSGGILTKDKPCVLHRCDNSTCCNPNHLFAGSRADNNYDMVAKGRNRGAKGESDGNSKLKEKDVIKIFYMCNKKNMNKKVVANIFGISLSAIHRVLSKKTWSHVNIV